MSDQQDIDAEVKKSLGPEQDLEEQFRWAVEYWEGRNLFIQQARDMVDGKNTIDLPAAVQYKAKQLHTYLMASIANEKASRYLTIPEPQIIVEDPLDPKSRDHSTRIERGLDVISYEMERMGGGDVWSRAVWDSIILDGGVELIERIPHVAWKGLADNQKDYPLGSKKREDYKKEHGVPIRSLYVPLESIFPIYDDASEELIFHIEYKSLWACRRNSLYDQSAFDDFEVDDPTRGLNTEIAIVRIANRKYYGYYALYPSKTTRVLGEKRDASEVDTQGELRYLYGYKHGLSNINYNIFAGKFGGWKTDTNRVESTGRALMELNQAADEIVSQVFTNIRAKYWGSLKFAVDPEARGYSAGQTPEPPEINEGEPFVMFKGEELSPIYQNENDTSVPWLMDQIKESLGNLGGSSVLFGRREPGVDTGYMHATQISQAEHLDEKQEQHAQTGGIKHYTLILQHIQQIGESVWAHYTDNITINDKNRKKGTWAEISPKELDPLPRIDVRVRKPRPVDFMSSIRAAREASDEREGKGPLYSDDTIRERIMGDAHPAIEGKKVDQQKVRNDLIGTGIITNKVGELINMKLARQGVPEVSPEQLGQIDPSMLPALQQMIESGEIPPGGLSPEILARLTGVPGGAAASVQNPLNRSGGVLPGDAQPEARLGEQIARDSSV
jgi:hypothetical protein